MSNKYLTMIVPLYIEILILHRSRKVFLSTYILIWFSPLYYNVGL